MQTPQANFASVLTGFESAMPVCGVDSWLDPDERAAGARGALLDSRWFPGAAP